jgi:hypothetical protein
MMSVRKHLLDLHIIKSIALTSVVVWLPTRELWKGTMNDGQLKMGQSGIVLNVI